MSSGKGDIRVKRAGRSWNPTQSFIYTDGPVGGFMIPAPLFPIRDFFLALSIIYHISFSFLLSRIIIPINL
jgi:hypothetical protein